VKNNRIEAVSVQQISHPFAVATIKRIAMLAVLKMSALQLTHKENVNNILIPTLKSSRQL
jgi:hypothetical protein